MDPDEIYARLLEAIKAKDRETAANAFHWLGSWMNAGGAMPEYPSAQANLMRTFPTMDPNETYEQLRDAIACEDRQAATKAAFDLAQWMGDGLEMPVRPMIGVEDLDPPGAGHDWDVQLCKIGADGDPLRLPLTQVALHRCTTVEQRANLPIQWKMAQLEMGNVGAFIFLDGLTIRDLLTLAQHLTDYAGRMESF